MRRIVQGSRVKSVVGMYHETMLFYGRVLSVVGGSITVRKENPGNEPVQTRSAIRLWELASEKEKAPVYPTTVPYSLKNELAKRDALDARKPDSKVCAACGKPI